jgi:hypothetical protein
MGIVAVGAAVTVGIGAGSPPQPAGSQASRISNRDTMAVRSALRCMINLLIGITAVLYHTRAEGARTHRPGCSLAGPERIENSGGTAL